MGGSPEHEPTQEQRDMVSRMSAMGVVHADIAKSLGINHKTLSKHYSSELHNGRVDANNKIAGTLFQKAQEGDTAAMIFWLKTRARWKDAAHEDSHELKKKELELKIRQYEDLKGAGGGFDVLIEALQSARAKVD